MNGPSRTRLRPRGRSVAFVSVFTALLAVTPAFVSPSAGASSANRFAVLDEVNHKILGGSGLAGVTILGTGQYEVKFTDDVSGCAYIATPINTYSQAITVFTAGGHLSPQGVYVETKNQGGGLTDGAFNLVVVCDGGTGTSYAVVGYAADLVRSTPGTTLTPLGAGRYQVRFSKNVSKCAYLATVGDPGTELVFYPSGVYTGSGPDSRTVYVETKNPGGGLQDGVPFHLAALCPSAPDTRVEVVRADGLYRRGTALSFRSATGQYTVVTERDVSGCATVGTRGSVDRAVPFFPTTIEVVPGPALNTVGLQERELLFFGGNFFDDSVHTAIVCGGSTP